MSRVLVALRIKTTPERAFEAFTREIAQWWRPNLLFSFTGQDTRALRFEPGVGGRFLMTLRDGSEFEIGRVQLWEPPSELAFSWRQRSFAPEQSTHVRVRFEAVLRDTPGSDIPGSDTASSETRVTVEHTAWDTIPQKHVARHGFPLHVFQLRHAEWWQALLATLAQHATRT
ncbi:MAG: hypothetical protein RL033_1180 [Pseudomonadota bacterium]